MVHLTFAEIHEAIERMVGMGCDLMEALDTLGPETRRVHLAALLKAFGLSPEEEE
jgi:hypothetical protein